MVEMPRFGILEIKLFDVWGIDFISPFLPFSTHRYILIVVNYMPKWVEIVTLPTNKTLCYFLSRNILNRFGLPRTMVNDGGFHLYNGWRLHWENIELVIILLYPITLRPIVRLTYLIENWRESYKKTMRHSWKDWTNKLDDALWAQYTTFKTPTRTSFYQLVCRRAHHLLVELEYREYWAIKLLNWGLRTLKRKVNLMN